MEISNDESLMLEGRKDKLDLTTLKWFLTRKKKELEQAQRESSLWDGRVDVCLQDVSMLEFEITQEEAAMKKRCLKDLAP